jgi:Na+-driven multidrug efflux pump
MEQNQNFLGNQKGSKLMRQYAIPCIISLLVGALYNIVDQIFIANASYLGSYGNAANMVVFPLTVIALAIAVMLGDGCCAFVSLSLGQNRKVRKYLYIGAGLKERVKKLFSLLLICEAAVGVVTFIIVEFFPQQLTNIFGAVNESVYYTEFAIKAFHIYLCMMIFACINKATFIFLQAMGKAVASTVLSMIREILFGVGFALLLPLFFGLDGVLYSMPASDILTFIVSLIVIVFTYKQLSVKAVIRK